MNKSLNEQNNTFGRSRHNTIGSNRSVHLILLQGVKLLKFVLGECDKENGWRKHANKIERANDSVY